MKTLKETFVIVKLYEGQYDFFQNYISFDEVEIRSKCEELNREANIPFEKNHTKRKIKTPFVPSVIFFVHTLEDAIEKFRDDVADYYTEHDESY
ncbi:MAG: hypothetical protein AABY15_02045 [Nanoarchaeota archaeon]